MRHPNLEFRIKAERSLAVIMHKFRITVRCIPRGSTRAEVLKYFQSFCEDATFSFEKDQSSAAAFTRMGTVYVTNLKDVQKLLSVKHLMAGSVLDCQQTTLEANPSSGASNLKLRRIFLRNVKRPIDDGVLELFFSKFGDTESAYIVKSNKNGLSRGFGYVTFKDVGPAEQLLKKGEIEILNHIIKIYPFQKYSKPAKTDQLSSQENELNLSSENQGNNTHETQTGQIGKDSMMNPHSEISDTEHAPLASPSSPKYQDSPATRSENTGHATAPAKFVHRDLAMRHIRDNLVFNISHSRGQHITVPHFVETSVGCVCWLKASL